MTGEQLAGVARILRLPEPLEPGMADYHDAVRRAAEVLAEITGVTWVSLFPARGGGDGLPRVHVMVHSAASLHAMAAVEADSAVVPAYDDGGGRTGPSWVGWINGIWLHVDGDMEERPAS